MTVSVDEVVHSIEHGDIDSKRAEGNAKMRYASLATWCQQCGSEINVGDAIFPIDGVRGQSKRSSLSWIHLDCAEAAGGGQAPPIPVCKHFLRSGWCHYGATCFFAHPEDAGVAAVERIRTRRNDPNAKVANRGEGRRNRVKNYSKAGVLRRWLLDTFTLDILKSGSGVLDVAGGKGELAWELLNLNLVPSLVLEPRPLDLSSAEKKWKSGIFWRNPIFHGYVHCKHDPYGPLQNPGHLRALLTPEVVRWLARERNPHSTYNALKGEEAYGESLRRAKELRWTRKGLHEEDEGSAAVQEDKQAEALSDRDEDKGSHTEAVCDEQQQDGDDEDVDLADMAFKAINSCSVIAALHPDQAAEFAIQLALVLNKPFAVVPCCVYSAEFPKRKLARTGQQVKTYHELLEYLQGLDPRIQRTELDFEGKATLLFMTADDAAKSLPSPEVMELVFGSGDDDSCSDAGA